MIGNPVRVYKKHTLAVFFLLFNYYLFQKEAEKWKAGRMDFTINYIATFW